MRVNSKKEKKKLVFLMCMLLTLALGIGYAVLSQQFAAELQKENIYVTGFYYPVVPKGLGRIRIQLSAAHTREQLDRAIAAFIKIGKKLNVIK